MYYVLFVLGACLITVSSLKRPNQAVALTRPPLKTYSHLGFLYQVQDPDSSDMDAYLKNKLLGPFEVFRSEVRGSSPFLWKAPSPAVPSTVWSSGRMLMNC